MVNKPVTGSLYLIPTPLGDTPVTDVLPQKTIACIHQLRYFIVEELRTARRFLRAAGFTADFDREVTFFVLNEHTRREEVAGFLEPLAEGHDAGLLSEAGVPCIADPGSALVQSAHEQGFRVVPLTGPSSLVLALMASGFNGQNFVFHGYLPVEDALRTKKIRELERQALERDQAQIFIETPYRNQKLFEALTRVCQPGTRLCVAADLTLASEVIGSMTIAEWRGRKPDLHKRPAVFLIY